MELKGAAAKLWKQVSHCCTLGEGEGEGVRGDGEAKVYRREKLYGSHPTTVVCTRKIRLT